MKKEKKKSGQEAEKEAKKEASEEQIAELTITLKRIQAEFENYRKRTERDRQKIVEQSNREFVRELLPVLDVFELALGTIKEHNDTTKGFEMVHQQIEDLLKNHGVEIIDAVNVAVDPTIHEVVEQGSGHKVDRIIQKGYRLHDYVIRPARVAVTVAEKAEQTAEQTTDLESPST